MVPPATGYYIDLCRCRPVTATRVSGRPGARLLSYAAVVTSDHQRSVLQMYWDLLRCGLSSACGTQFEVIMTDTIVQGLLQYQYQGRVEKYVLSSIENTSPPICHIFKKVGTGNHCSQPISRSHDKYARAYRAGANDGGVRGIYVDEVQEGECHDQPARGAQQREVEPALALGVHRLEHFQLRCRYVQDNGKPRKQEIKAQ